jgi:hypothetical protein
MLTLGLDFSPRADRALSAGPDAPLVVFQPTQVGECFAQCIDLIAFLWRCCVCGALRRRRSEFHLPHPRFRQRKTIISPGQGYGGKWGRDKKSVCYRISILIMELTSAQSYAENLLCAMQSLTGSLMKYDLRPAPIQIWKQH